MGGGNWEDLRLRTCGVHLGCFVVGLAGEANSDEAGDGGAVPSVSKTPSRRVIGHSYKKPMARRPQSRSFEFLLIFTFHSRMMGAKASTKSEIAAEAVRALLESHVRWQWADSVTHLPGHSS